jgi:hypothetical protein
VARFKQALGEQEEIFDKLALIDGYAFDALVRKHASAASGLGVGTNAKRR